MNTNRIKHGDNMPTTHPRTATPAKKKVTPRKPPAKVKRNIEVAVQLKGIGCEGQAVTLTLKMQGDKLVIEAEEHDGGRIHRMHSADGVFKTTPQDLRQALDLVTEEITIKPAGQAKS